MFPKPIGILGGAGPLAGAALLDRVFTLCGNLYGCYRDSDFPKVVLISFPFSEMLSPSVEKEQLQKELSEGLNQLRRNGASVLAIACNTLHAFLRDDEDLTDLIHLPLAIAQEVSEQERPLVLCTSTSARFGLHKRYFPCVYPSPETQQLVDCLIDRILKDAKQEGIVEDLLTLLRSQNERTVILGCTELSLFTSRLQPDGQKLIDPLEIVAKKLLEKSFTK